MEYATDNHVEMVPEKTKLLCYAPRGQGDTAYYWKAACPISMDGHNIKFSEEAEHVGILHSSKPGNMPNVLARQSAHTRALFGVLSSGLAKNHSGNQATGLRVEKLYGAPVLLSGLAALVLSDTEISCLDHHYKVSLERLQRHYKATPSPVVFFMAGSLPAPALLHMRQFSLLGMVSRLGPNNILFQNGWSVLATADGSPHSWFIQVRELSTQYSLPDPLHILDNPSLKASFKRLVKQKVIDWWQTKLRAKAASLPSLDLFRSEFMSLSRPHPIWTSAGASSYEVKKATVQARMLGGRYRTCWLRRHLSGDDSGTCKVPGCSNQLGTLLNIATAQCLGLHSAKVRAVAIWADFLKDNQLLFPLIRDFSLGDPQVFLEFLVDPTTNPKVITLAQKYAKNYDVVSKLC